MSATFVSISPADGYPTQTSMRVDVSFQVTYAATYHTEFEVREGSSTGAIVQKATGKSFTLPKDGQKDGIYKTFDGLTPRTNYTIVCWLCNSSTATRLVKDTLSFTTKKELQQKIVYRSGSEEAEQTIQGEDTLGDGGGFFTVPDGFSFYGWAKSTGSTVPNYYAGQEYTATSNNTLYLYAIWKCEDTTGVTFYYGYNRAKADYRKLLGYAYNRSDRVQTTKFESVKTPALTMGNVTVVKRAFSPIGWRSDTDNNGSDLTGGNQYIAVAQDRTVFYAVYQNTAGIRVSYNSNGGSGTMTSSTVPGTMYYNTGKKSPTTINVTPRACTFTPPKGYQFKGWSTSASGSLVTSINTSYDATFYAQWISARPADWDWSGYLYLNGVKTPYNMTVGGKPPMVKQSDGSYYAYYMGAAEWNKFVKRIEEVASYLGISLNVRDINGASATAGQKMLTYQAQCIVNMLNTLGATNVPSVPTSMSVSFFNGIRDSLNNRKNR